MTDVPRQDEDCCLLTLAWNPALTLPRSVQRIRRIAGDGS